MHILVAITALLIVPPAEPKESVTARFSEAYQSCMLYGELHNTIAMPPGVCEERESLVQDARLNRAYAIAMARLPASRKAILRTSQRRWIGIRDRICSAKGDGRTECLAVETNKRTRFLTKFR